MKESDDSASLFSVFDLLAKDPDEESQEDRKFLKKTAKIKNMPRFKEDPGPTKIQPLHIVRARSQSIPVQRMGSDAVGRKEGKEEFPDERQQEQSSLNKNESLRLDLTRKHENDETSISGSRSAREGNERGKKKIAYSLSGGLVVKEEELSLEEALNETKPVSERFWSPRTRSSPKKESLSARKSPVIKPLTPKNSQLVGLSERKKSVSFNEEVVVVSTKDDGDGSSSEEVMAFLDFLDQDQPTKIERSDSPKGSLQSSPKSSHLKEHSGSGPRTSKKGTTLAQLFRKRRNSTPVAPNQAIVKAAAVPSPEKGRSMSVGETAASKDSVLSAKEQPDPLSMSLELVGQLLENCERYFALRNFCESSLCEENVDVLWLTREFLSCPAQKNQQLAAKIMKTFVSDKARRPINVDSRTRDALLRDYEAVKDNQCAPVQLFSKFDHQIVLLIHTDILPRFWVSDMFQKMKRGENFRKATVGETSVLLSFLEDSCKEEEWVVASHPSSSEVFLWEPKGTPGVKSSKPKLLRQKAMPKCRASVSIKGIPIEEVMSVLSKLTDYPAWVSSKIGCEKVLDFGTFCQVVELSIGKHSMLVCGLYCKHSSREHAFVMQSISPSVVEQYRGGSNLTTMELSGFLVTEKEDDVCEVVVVFRVSSGNSSDLVIPLLSGLQSRCEKLRTVKKDCKFK